MNHSKTILSLLLLSVLLLPACDRSSPNPSTPAFAEVRRQFKTNIVNPTTDNVLLADPPPNLFQIVEYNSPIGSLPGYITSDPHDNLKHPAIIWIHGGDCNSIGDVWSPQEPDNDQSAAAYRKAGIIMLYPSLRGGNASVSSQEYFYGEVDDILAAADFLATQPYVDPSRIYLGGHSTGGTLALLVAESSPRFRAVFCLGPVDDIRKYGTFLPTPFDPSNPEEYRLRNPINWLKSIASPTFILEGDSGRRTNIDCLRLLAAKCPATIPAYFLPIPNATHFSAIASTNTLISKKILADTGPQTNITIDPHELIH